MEGTDIATYTTKVSMTHSTNNIQTYLKVSKVTKAWVRY